MVSFCLMGVAAHRRMHTHTQTDTHLPLWFFSIILSLLHGSGHLVHCGDDGAAGLAHTIKATRTMGTVHLEEGVKGLN